VGGVAQVLEQLPRKERKSNAGRKAIDPMILFKTLAVEAPLQPQQRRS
jgi:hypothetical protein